MNSNGKRAIQVGSKWVDRSGARFEVIGVTGAGFGEEEESVTTRAESGGVHTWYAFHSFLTWLSDPLGIPVTIGSKWIGSISGTEYEIDELKETCVIFKDKSRYCEGDTYELFRGPRPLYTPAPVKWVPRVGEPALVTGIAEECCRDWAPVTSLIGQTLVVRDIRQQVSGKTGYDFAECPVLAHVTLAEPKKKEKPVTPPEAATSAAPATPARRVFVGQVYSNGEYSYKVIEATPSLIAIKCRESDYGATYSYTPAEFAREITATILRHASDPPAFLPKKGDKVRLVELQPGTSKRSSRHNVGDVFIASSSEQSAGVGPEDPAWAFIGDSDGRFFWGRVELVEAAAPEVKPPSPKSLTWGSFVIDITASLPPSSARRVDSAMAQLGPNARGLLADIADRLVVGKAHGDFEKPADWTKEAYEEDLDGIVYRAMRMRQAKGKAA